MKAHEPIPFGRSYDYVVSTWTTFNMSWDVEANRAFLRDCRAHLHPGGTVFLRFNVEGFKDRSDVEAFYRSAAAFPVLNDDHLAVLDDRALARL